MDDIKIPTDVSDHFNRRPTVADLELIEQYFPKKTGYIIERNAKRLPFAIEASVIRANGATVLVRNRDISHFGVGMMHYGTIGKRGDHIVVKMNSETKTHAYSVKLMWQTRIPNTNLWISGGEFLGKVDPQNDCQKILRTADTTQVREETRIATSQIASDVRRNIQRHISGTFPEDEHPFIGEIDGDSITITTDRHTIHTNETLRIWFTDEKGAMFSAVVQLKTIEIINSTQMQITGVLSGKPKINN